MFKAGGCVMDALLVVRACEWKEVCEWMRTEVWKFMWCVLHALRSLRVLSVLCFRMLARKRFGQRSAWFQGVVSIHAAVIIFSRRVHRLLTPHTGIGMSLCGFPSVTTKRTTHIGQKRVKLTILAPPTQHRS